MKHTNMAVEDDDPILELRDVPSRRLRYEPVLIANRLPAPEIIRKDPPALILPDIMMTLIDGGISGKTPREYGIRQVR